MCWLEFRETRWHLVFLGGLLVLVLVVLQEEVVAGHGERPNQDDELCEVHLAVVVGVQVTHDLVHGILVLSILLG